MPVLVVIGGVSRLKFGGSSRAARIPPETKTSANATRQGRTDLNQRAFRDNFRMAGITG